MRKDRLLRLRVPLGFVLAAWYLLVVRPASLTILAASCALVIAGCLLRSWAAGYLFKGKRVAVGGPYASVRNPLYVGSFLIGVGFCAALWRKPLPLSAILFWAAFAVGFVGVYPAKARAEEGELRRSLGEPYLAYARRVPAFFPIHGPVRGLGEQRFSWELYRRNREYQCWAGSLGIIAVLFLKYSHVL